jgi:hypothetical protein
VVEADGWFVKLRSTHDAGLDTAYVGDALSHLMNRLGVPDTSGRLAVARRNGLERSRTALAQLAAWRAAPADAARAVTSRVDALRAQGSFAEAADLLLAALGQGLHPATLQAELGRLYLFAGDLLGAVEACMAEEEQQTSAERDLESALRAYDDDRVAYGGGWGTAPRSAVVINGGHTASICTNAMHRYLGYLLGERGTEWKARRAAIATIEGRVYEAVDVTFAWDHEATLFFTRDAAPTFPAALDGQVLGSTTLDEDLAHGGAEQTVSPDLGGEESARFVVERLLEHTAMSLVLRGG